MGNKRKIVEIEWVDAQSSLERFTIEELNQLTPLHTYSTGYLLIDKKDLVVLGFMDFGENLIKHWQMIPRKMIKEIKVLREAN